MCRGARLGFADGASLLVVERDAGGEQANGKTDNRDLKYTGKSQPRGIFIFWMKNLSCRDHFQPQAYLVLFPVSRECAHVKFGKVS